ncbi:TIGR03826 family flagellar region protein [Cytobacillus purgationiresistens]|uniref:Flagellar operon protein (TIGR03826 family) n=1 Tax=Cytobacillus purgationiresistens TaxID=863449 RepID=A0ABU0ACV9_9BACI|nr:TIGR03826 family flagellar region protein [Cytobacillus purgationiresistens]MDQ0269096.1 flagellar operon protein (TIGR03826 family) [Cytobacillus purgationiresistens]
MAELMNCPKCNALFVKNQMNVMCNTCFNEEEKAFKTVHQFLRKRENRAATMDQIVHATEVEEALLLKFIRSGRLKITQFPNLGYPCDQCGHLIREGKLCDRCISEIKKELELHMREEERRTEHQKTYFSINKD